MVRRREAYNISMKTTEWLIFAFISCLYQGLLTEDWNPSDRANSFREYRSWISVIRISSEYRQGKKRKSL